jgi:LacI family transcriptional regulator
MMGIVDVARRAGVSPGTVSNYLNRPHVVAPETGERIRNAIDELGYIGNDAARTMRVGRTKTIATIPFEGTNPAVFDVNAAIEQRAAELGYAMVVANSAGSIEQQSKYLDLFASQRVSGILLSPVGDPTERIRALRRMGVHVVIVGTPWDPEVSSSVFVDSLEGGRLAAEHLIECGRRKLCFVGGPLELTPVRQRLDGAAAAAAKGGASLSIVTTETRTIHAGREAARQLLSLDSLPDGIFAANDLIAIGLLHEFVASGRVRVPEDISLVGFDDIEFARDAIIPITSVHRPSAPVGYTAVDALLADIEAADHGNPFAHTSHRYMPRLVQRATTTLPRS